MDAKWQISCALVPLSYILLVAMLRHQRARRMPRRFGFIQDDYTKMTADQAQMILKELTELEFPTSMGFSIIFAVFKICGIPSIASLLVATKQLLNPATASKRTSDTQTLLFEFAFNKPSSTRAIQAIARMNFLHSPYQKSGKILDADMLYTLSLFALEPVRWINRYEWRTLTDLELCASGTFWKAMGDAMHISFEVLPSGRTGWKDGRHWLAEVNDWSIKYESDNMVPSHLSNRLAKAQMSVLFMNLPATLNGIAMKAVSFIQGDRLRKAMMFPELSAPYMTAFKTILLARKYLLRYLALPRLELMRMDYLPVESNSGRYNMQEWVGHPWYIKPTFKRRWGPGALMTRFLGGKVPGDGGNRYLPQGFLVSEIGPDYFRGEGVQATTRTKAELEEMKRGGCPFRIV